LQQSGLALLLVTGFLGGLMPKAPTYDNFQTIPNVPNMRAADPISVEAAGMGGRRIQQPGEVIQNVALTQSKIAHDMQKEANQLRVDAARNRRNEIKMRLAFDPEAGFTNIRGLDALEPKSGKPLEEEYGETYKKKINEIAETLGNDAQKMAFLEDSKSDYSRFRQEIIQHEGRQFREYAVSVREGTIKNRMNEIGLRYNDPMAVDEAITSIKASAYDLARKQGKSAEWAEANTRELTSKAHLTALSAALQNNDPSYAHSYLKKYAGDMSADDILKAQGSLTKELDSKLALGVASDVIHGAVTRIQTPDSERAFNIAIQTESGGRQMGPDGKPLTSSEGAIGIAQVMPTTGPEAAKLAGLEWDENRFKNDEAYNRALGKAYFDKQVKDNQGNLMKAYAAYNAGPGRLADAV
jgi:soluble lytic murein transglycosylase